MPNFCDEPACTGIAVSGKWCALHVADNYIKRRNALRPERDGWYSLAAWRGPFGVRGYHLRNFPMCELVGCGKAATDVHHLNGDWKTTGNFRDFIDQNNLQSLCHEHHSEITLKEQQNGKQHRS